MTSIAQMVIETALSKGISINIGADGTVQIGGASIASSTNPEYISDTIPNLPRGEVTRQVRGLKKLGSTKMIRAHQADTIRAAMNSMGWGAKVETTNDPYIFRVTRTRINRRK